MLAKEAAIIIGAVDATIVALVALVAWVLKWDTEFAALLVTALQSVIVLIGAILTRGQVYSQATVDKLLAGEQNDG